MSWLDGLRSIAALLVLASHVGGALNASFLQWELQTFNIGHGGVILFFLISGYIIPRSLAGGQRRFWVRRVMRLLPIYWIAMAYVLLGTPWPSPSILGLNAVMLPVQTLVTPLVPGVWTLGIEVVWYMLLSALTAMRVQHAYLAVWITLAGASLLVDGVLPLIVGWVPPPLFSYLPIFWAGLLLELWQRKAISTRLAWGLYAATLLMVTVPPPPRNLLLWANEPNHIWPRIVAFVIFAAVVLWGRGWSRPRILIWIGERSYGLYLLHGFVLVALPLPWPLTAATWVVAALLLSDLAWRFVERPAITFGRRVTQAR